MNVILRNLSRKTLQIIQTKPQHFRTFLSQAYYCNEVWEHRLQDPILSKVNLEEFYQDIEQRHHKTGKISAIDVDIFANALKDITYIEELLDLTHRLRLSAETQNTLNSTSHAVIRYLNGFKKDETLLKVLDDRLNYGIFLDYYTANLLMNDYYKKNEFANGARVAAQLMLQEEFDNPLSIDLGLLNCYNYLLSPEGWPEPQPPEETEEEVKIRVKYLRNPYDDDHFDLREPNKIIGKTLVWFTKNPKDSLEKSLHFLGLFLYGKIEIANKFLTNLDRIHSDILKFLPEDNEIHQKALKITQDTENVQNLLVARVKDSERKIAEKDIAAQCELYNRWSEERKLALAEQTKRLRNERRLANIEDLKKDMKTRETKLWFFENEEKIELNILSKKRYYKKKWVGMKRQGKKIDETYVPPVVR